MRSQRIFDHTHPDVRPMDMQTAWEHDRDHLHHGGAFRSKRPTHVRDADGNRSGAVQKRQVVIEVR